MSESAGLRRKGNILYKLAFADDMTESASMLNLAKAQQCYGEAVNLADNPRDLSSAAKNLGLSAWKVAQLELSLAEPINEVFESYRISLDYFQRAINFGTGRGKAWVKEVKENQYRCCQAAVNCAVQIFKGKQRARFIESIVKVLENRQLKAMCYLAIAKAFFFGALDAYQSDDDYKASLSLLHDCHFPLEESARLYKGNLAHDSKISDLRKDVTLNLFIAESIQARKTGDSILKKALEDEEDLNIDWVWEAVDWYKKAIILTREKQVEYEAVALSRLGSLYYKVLKLKTRAKDNFRWCMQLALALYPRSPENEEWFKEAKSALDTMQQEYLQTEEVQQQMERQKYMKMLKSEIADLQRLDNKSDEEIVRHIYKTYPPVNKKHKLPIDKKKELTRGLQKKALQKAILHYDPEKVDVEAHGLRTKYLYTEISKLLAKHHSHIKI